MKLKNKTYYYEGIKVFIIGVKNCESRIVLISPISDTRYDWLYEMNEFYRETYNIDNIHKNRKYVYGIEKDKLRLK